MKKKQGNENILLPDRVMKLFAPRAFALMAFMALLTCGLVRQASADIYWFTDETGVVHFSNVPTDKRYVPFTAANDAVVKKVIAGTRDRRADTPAKAQYSAIIEEIARIYALESALVHAVVSAESAYNATAVSKKGAAGLMQLMPDTARRYGVTDRFDPVQNLHAGAKYLSDLLRMFNGNLSLALAGYNAGENSVVKYGNRIPPFQETRNYVPRVLDLYQKYQVSMKLVQPQRGT
jgi:soluble lytic murein transglycosylase-like protein